MRKYVCMLAIFGTLLYSGVSSAKIYWLPDYLGKNMERTYVPDNGSHSTEVFCSTYGLYNSVQSGMICSETHPTVGLTCYSCQSCGSEYQYTAADCPTLSYSLSEQCGGKYKTCSCNTALYLTTSTTTGCPSGQVPDTSKYCEDKPSGTKHYACANVNCNSENITVEECKAKGNNCTASTEANCADYCDTNGCLDNCTYIKQTGQARSDCSYGCATGKDVSGCSDLCYECGEAPESPTSTCADIYDGQSNTTAIIKQLGADALAATAANQYYVGDKNGDFGQGKWYLPAIGELVDMYGVDPAQITSGSGKTGAFGRYIGEFNRVLTTLYDKGIDADILSDSYWSSSEHSANHVWTLTVSSANGSGNRSTYTKDWDYKVRPFLEVEKCFDARYYPFVGRVMYEDKAWGGANRYYSGNGKKPVGIIVSVNKTDNSVKIISLKNLTFSSTGSSGNFNANNPYRGNIETSVWTVSDKKEVDITKISNYSSDQLKTMLKKCATKEDSFRCAGIGTLAAIFDGKRNTQEMVAQLGNEALAAYAATQFYVGDKNGEFGQGKWYLPAIGELIDMYGIDVSQMTKGEYASGAVGDTQAKINAALTTLKDKGVEAEALGDDYYLSACGDALVWALNLSSGSREYLGLYRHYYVRSFQLLENCFNSASISSPKIGDVMYADKTWGSANDYDGSKTPVGIVVAVSTVSGSVKIVSLKDLTFSSETSADNFDPDNPYGGNTKGTWPKVKGGEWFLVSITDKEIFDAFKNCQAHEW